MLGEICADADKVMYALADLDTLAGQARADCSRLEGRLGQSSGAGADALRETARLADALGAALCGLIQATRDKVAEANRLYEESDRECAELYEEVRGTWGS